MLRTVPFPSGVASVQCRISSEKQPAQGYEMTAIIGQNEEFQTARNQAYLCLPMFAAVLASDLEFVKCRVGHTRGRLSL